MAIVHGYVPNDGDAWHYTLDHLQQYYERVRTRVDRQAPLPDKKSLLDLVNEPAPAIMEDTIGPYLDSARLLGQRTADLHLALGSPNDKPVFAPEPITITYQRSLYHSMRGYAVQVLQLLRQFAGLVPEEARVDAEKVLSSEAQIISTFMNIAARKINAMRIRIHGDYHLGQVLHAGNDFVIIDYEGEPARPLTERRLKRSPLRDVSGMIRTLYYAAYAHLIGGSTSVLRPEDVPVLEPWAQAWYAWVSSVFLKAYLEAMKDSNLLPKNSDQLKTLLNVLLLDKAIYEIGYELNHRPGWIKLPLRGVLQILETSV